MTRAAWLIALLLVAGCSQKMTDMADTTDQIGQLGTVDNSNQSHLSELTGKLQGLTQEIGLLSNALTNTLKSLGDASATLARTMAVPIRPVAPISATLVTYAPFHNSAATVCRSTRTHARLAP